MNKAFVREPEFDGRAFCPACGSLGEPVASPTLDYFIRAEKRSLIGDSAWFCPFADCEVAYFNLMETSVGKVDLVRGVYPKDPAAPICGCFGMTEDEVEGDIAEGAPRRIRELLAKSKGDQANCLVLSPSGRCCLPDIQKLYIRGINRSN